MVTGEQIAEADLKDWRKLAQGLHARYLMQDFGAGARFVDAVGAAGDEAGHHPLVRMEACSVELKLVSHDAVYRDSEGTEHPIQWVTQADIDLARRISEIAAEQQARPDPSAVSHIELGLDTARSEQIAPVWVALLTGNPEDQGRGTPGGDEIRDGAGRVPNLWFADTEGQDPPRQRFHVEVYVAPEVVQQRISAALAAGGTIADDSESPGLTVIADPEGNTGVICADVSAAPTV